VAQVVGRQASQNIRAFTIEFGAGRVIVFEMIVEVTAVPSRHCHACQRVSFGREMENGLLQVIANGAVANAVAVAQP
jgi:hypothetical protein